MTVVLSWARLDLRRRWRSFAVLVLLIAFSSAVILSTLAGARRTDTVVPRLLAVSRSADIMVLPNKPGFDWSKVRTLPSVEALGTFVLTFGPTFTADHGLSGDSSFAFTPGDTAMYRDLDRPKLISGRYPDWERDDEALATPGFRHTYGDVVTLTLPTKAQVANSTDVQESTTEPNLGKVVHVHIVGEAVGSFGPEGAGQVLLTHGFFKDDIEPIYSYFANARVRLRGGSAAIPQFRDELATLTGNPNIDIVDWRAALASLQHAARFSATGWSLFAVAALVASIVLIGQSLARFSSVAVDDLRTLAALGLDPRGARRATMALPALAAVLGVCLGIGGAVAVSGLFPTGGVRGDEPSPGITVNSAILGIGALALLVLAVVGARVVAARATRSVDGSRERRSIVAALAARIGLGPPAVLGTRFALEPGRGRSRVPVRPALVGAVAGVLGIVGAFTFRAGLDGAAKDPARFGQTMPYGAFLAFNGGLAPAQVTALHAAAADSAIEVLDDLRVAVFEVDGRQVSSFSLAPLAGTVRTVSLSGRAPATPDEIALGPTTAKALHVGVGDTVKVVAGSTTRTLTVSGVTFVPQDAHNGYADGAWLTGAGFSSMQPEADDKYHEARFALKPGVDVDAALGRLNKLLGGVSPAPPVAEQANLKTVRLQPLLLGVFLLLLAVGAVGHALAVSVRRRRHDVAVLRALGMTRWQSRLTVAVQATVLAVVGLAFGIPLGIAAGRSAWRALADATPVLYVPPLAAVAVLLSVPIAVAAANTLAALPARRAARLEVGRILRAE